MTAENLVSTAVGVAGAVAIADIAFGRRRSATARKTTVRRTTKRRKMATKKTARKTNKQGRKSTSKKGRSGIRTPLHNVKTLL